VTQPVTRAGVLLAAAASASTSFQGVPAAPVQARGTALSPRECGQVAGRYARHGFAVLRLTGPVTPGTPLELAAALGLGRPFVPPLYTRNGAPGAPVSRISAAFNTGTPDARHPSFGQTGGQHLHCDGTLQQIGHIKASLLVCESPAAAGGDTILFNAAAAYAQLAAADPAAAVALATPGVLVRQANINGCTDVNAGPAFTVQRGRLVCGYSVTETDHWAVPDGVAAADLHRGVEFLRDAAAPGSRFLTQLRLSAGQAIAFDNTCVSHGRTPYRDSPGRRRCLYRSLHLRHPRAAVPAAAGVGGGEGRRD
jgi:alpha-ketoglutarate-dependent taurine dioxygenase